MPGGASVALTVPLAAFSAAASWEAASRSEGICELFTWLDRHFLGILHTVLVPCRLRGGKQMP